MFLQKFRGGARRMIELFFKIRGGAMPPCPTSSGPHATEIHVRQEIHEIKAILSLLHNLKFF